MKRFTIFFVFVTVLFGLFKLFVKTPQNNDEIIESFWTNKAHSEAKLDIIAAGDSRVYRGVSSKVSAALNEDYSFFNMAFSSAGLNHKYLDVVISKFNTNTKQKILLLGVSPHSLTQAAKQNEHFEGYLNKGKFEVFRYRYLSPFLKHFSAYKPTDILGTENYLQRYTKEGWVASDMVQPDSTYALKSYRQTFSKYQVEQKDMEDFITVVREINKQGKIEIIAFRPPTTLAMKELEDSISGFDENYVKNELQKAGVKWVDFDTTYTSYDGSHLNENAANALSEKLGVIVSELVE